ncbi:hypothetical protein H4R35_007383, partial [Dimargaris xerosporica]
LDDEDFDPFAPLPELELPPQTANADGSHGDTPTHLDALGTKTPENPYLVHNSPLAIDRAMLEDAVADEDDAIDHPGVGLVEASTAVTDQAPATNKRKKKKKKTKKNKKETKVPLQLECRLDNFKAEAKKYKNVQGEPAKALRHKYFTGYAMNLMIGFDG